MYQKIRAHANGRKIVLHCDAMQILGQTAPHVPKKLRYVILREMEDNYSMIRKIDKQKFMITGGNIDAKLERYSHPVIQ